MDEHNLLIAEAKTESMIEAEIKKARAAIPRQSINFDGLCVNPDCKEPIEPGRLKTGAITCLDCQIRAERQRALTGLQR